MSIETHRLDLGLAELHIEVSGQGPAIVLLHGFTGDASTMAVLTERLAADHTVIVPNLIGHGGSTGQDDQYSVDAMAAHVLDALAALDQPAPYDIVGYSMGGRLALTLGSRFPEQVASLALIGASAGLATEQERAERRAADEGLSESILADGLAVFVDGWMANPLFGTQERLGPHFLSSARSQRLQNSPEELVRSLRGAGTGSMRPLHDLLGECVAPVQLIVGEDDPKFRAIAAELDQALPFASVATIGHAGHAAHLEQPDAVATVIRSGLEAAKTRVMPISLPLRSTHTTGRGVTTRRDSVLLALRHDGHTGWGEASPLSGWSTDTFDAAVTALQSNNPWSEADSVWDATADRRAAVSSVPAARAALAGAALDVDARRAGLPLHHHLAAWHPSLHESRVLDSLAVNALVSTTDPDELARQMARHVAAGITVIKLKVGALAPEADVERVAVARAAAPGIVLRVDVNGAWDHDTAVWALETIAPHGVELCEEPVRGVAEIAAVGRASAVPVAVDESVRTSADLQLAMSQAGSIAAVVIKPQALGGPDLAIDAVQAARRAGLEVIVTSMIDSAVGVAHAASVAAACGLESAHGLATAEMLAMDVAVGLSIDTGRLLMSTEPGLGIGAVSPLATFRQRA